MIDSTVLTVASWLLEFMILGAIYWTGVLLHFFNTEGFLDVFNPFQLQVINLGAYALVAAPYYVIGHYRYGTTLGKKPLGIYVVDNATLGPITLKQSWIRCAGYIVSYLPFAAGYLMAAFHPEKRALHDWMAGTVSIRRKKVKT